MSDEITCLIADDHEVVREGLRLSLSRSSTIRVVGEASDGASAVAVAERRRPNVVIMDVRMPGMDGLEATKILAERLPQTAVLIFTAYGERSLLGRGLEAGAKGYILKEAPHQTLLRAIEKVASGEGYVDPALMPALLTREREEMLTVREREILQLLADGMSNADVAAEALHQPGDGEKPCPAHPRQARGGHAHPCSGDRAAGIHHRLTAALGCERARLGLWQRARNPRRLHGRRGPRRRAGTGLRRGGGGRGRARRVDGVLRRLRPLPDRLRAPAPRIRRGRAAGAGDLPGVPRRLDRRGLLHARRERDPRPHLRGGPAPLRRAQRADPPRRAGTAGATPLPGASA